MASKYHVKCSCILCKVETTAQSIKSHYTKYHQPTKFCPTCNAPIFTPANKFCSQSCAATFNNRNRDCRPGPKPGAKTKNSKPKYTKVRPCIICGKYHTGSGKTCSPSCKSNLISRSMKSRIHSGEFDPSQNRGRGKQSYLEESFDAWLKQHHIFDYFTEHPFKRLDMIKTYFADFIFRLYVW